MKYGYRSKENIEWTSKVREVGGTKFSSAVLGFNIDGYQSIMKRKTIDEADLIALDVLKDMVSLIEEKVKNTKRA